MHSIQCLAECLGYIPHAIICTHFRASSSPLVTAILRVKLAGTAGLQVEKLNNREVEVYLRNRRKIQNHIGGLHACSMALAAESATGMIVGMNVPDTHIPLIKSMNVNFVRRCQGDIRARATLSEEDYRRINEDDKGEVKVDVRVEDESGKEPIEAEMIWAWVSKDRGNRKKEKVEQEDSTAGE